MVLLELGQKITGALSKLGKSTVIDDSAFKSCLNEIGLALLQADVNIKYVKSLKDNIQMQFKMNQESGANLEKVVHKAVQEELTKMLEVDRKPFEPVKGKPNIVMFVGLQGSGKTTTCAKYAYYWIRKNYRVALVCADTFRAGAFDQLKQNATKIRVPFYGSYTETDPAKIAKEGVDMFKKEGFEIIIVDTSGRHKQEGELFDEMKQIEELVKPKETIFVMDGSIGQACFDQAYAFKKAVKVGSVIVTKLDGHAKGGGALSAVAATESPIIFIGSGEHFTDLEEFSAQSFISRLLGLGDLGKMVELVKGAMDEEEQLKMMERIQQGKFSLKDLKAQYQSVLKLGPLNQFASMIPGLGQQLMGQGNDKENVEKIKKQICLLDSMTEEELIGNKQLDDSRKRRISQGSGADPRLLVAMLDNYKQIKTLVDKFGKMKIDTSNRDLVRNPNRLKQELASAINPQMLHQLGGMENIMEMVKKLGGMEKAGQLGDLSSLMGGLNKKGKKK